MNFKKKIKFYKKKEKNEDLTNNINQQNKTFQESNAKSISQNNSLKREIQSIIKRLNNYEQYEENQRKKEEEKQRKIKEEKYLIKKKIKV